MNDEGPIEPEEDEDAPPAPVTQTVCVVQRPDSGELGLACIVKRTYALRPGRLALADEQIPLVLEPQIEIDDRGETRRLHDDSDLIAVKGATDVVVMGSAHAPHRVKELFIAVAIGDFARRLRVLGERRAEVRPDGTVRFGPTEPFERLPLHPEHAYGGYDQHAHDKLDPPPPRPAPVELPRDPFGPDLALAAPPDRYRGVYAYPRNTAGSGYFIDIDRARADGARLPRIEDPSDDLSPERFFVRAATAWIDAPIPGSLGWLYHAFYPRFVRCLGDLIARDPPARPIREIALGDGDDLAEARPLEIGKLHPRAIQGASPGLARGRLRGDEPVVLQHLHPRHPELHFALPGEAPRFVVRPPDIKSFSPKPVLQTVRIEPDRDLVSLVWCGVVRLFARPGEGFLERTELAVTWGGA
jgi:hypothetical protein